MRHWIVIALLLCLVASQARADHPALAPPKAPAARAHFTQGNRLYRVRKLDEAIAAYQAGASIEPAPVFDYNLGQCYRKLGRHADASWHYKRFLRNGRPEGELHALVTGFLRELRAEPERKASVPLRAEPERKASVSSASEPERKASVSSASEPERRAVVPPPAEQERRAVVPPPAEQERRAVVPPPAEQERKQKASVPPSAEQAARLRPLVGSSAVRSPSAPELSVTAVARGERWYADGLAWGLVAGGAAAAGSAGYLLSHAVGLQHESATTVSESRRLELRDRAHAQQLAGVALGVGGAALLATGALKLALHARAPARARAAAWSVGISGRGVAVLGRF